MLTEDSDAARRSRAGRGDVTGAADDPVQPSWLSPTAPMSSRSTTSGCPPLHVRTLELAGVRFALDRPPAKLLAQDKLHARRRFAALGFPGPGVHPRPNRDRPSRSSPKVHGWPLIAKSTARRVRRTRRLPARRPRRRDRRPGRDPPEGVLLEPHLSPRTRTRRPRGALRGRRAPLSYPVVKTVQTDGDVPGDHRARPS